MQPQHPPDDDKAAYQYAQYLKAHERKEAAMWADHRGDTLGVEPDFPTEIFGS